MDSILISVSELEQEGKYQEAFKLMLQNTYIKCIDPFFPEVKELIPLYESALS